ncbi:MAG: bile acid:sodium symporter, partial [Burkholderiaceae bacterium]
LIGIFLTPLLVAAMFAQGAGATVSLDSLRAILLQLLLPFVAGQMARRWIGAWVERHRAVLGSVDRSSILLVVYTAFSEAVIEGLWQQIPPTALAGLLVACAVLLALALGATTFAARQLGFSKEDEITIVFCGSKKSLASGIPMARVLFASQAVGAVVLPLMLFHQLQLMVCAVLAQRYARRPLDVVSEAAQPRMG